jgi:molecular chaperone GrpE
MFEAEHGRKTIPITSEDPAPAAEEPTMEDAGAADPIAELRAELEQERDARLRVMAELQNFRKRSAQERQQALEYACEPLAGEIIPVLDHFEMATAAGATSDETRIFCKGYEMILQQLRDALSRHGLEEIPAVAGMYFDPEYHEAVERVVTEDPCEGTVMKVLQKGYRMRERVLRPVRVAVAVAPEG